MIRRSPDHVRVILGRIRGCADWGKAAPIISNVLRSAGLAERDASYIALELAEPDDDFLD